MTSARLVMRTARLETHEKWQSKLRRLESHENKQSKLKNSNQLLQLELLAPTICIPCRYAKTNVCLLSHSTLTIHGTVVYTTVSGKLSWQLIVTKAVNKPFDNQPESWNPVSMINVYSQIKQTRLKPLNQSIWQPPPLHSLSYQPPDHRGALAF